MTSQPAGVGAERTSGAMAGAHKERMGTKRVVAIGGGTGTYTVLSGFKRHEVDLTAVVSMADNGGSSGVLRDEFGHLPPGDVRRCLIALSAEPASGMLRRLFEYRFDRGHGLNGHNFGNLLLTALTEITGAPDQAIQEAAKILNVRGRVLPVTLTDTHLCARLEDGTIIRGETNIDIRRVRPHLRIIDVYLDPPATAYPAAVQAIEGADIVVIGPGDLYSSVIPNLLVEGIPDAIAQTKAKVVYVCNLMTKHGETDGFTACDFVREIERYLGTGDGLDAVLVSEGDLPGDLLEKYAKELSFPVKPEVSACQCLVPQVIVGSLAAPGILWRHDADALADALLSLSRA
jgi:uncharacterized cofD-like protein